MYFVVNYYCFRLYLPSELSVKEMLKTYVEENPANSVSYSIYWRLVKDLGISFTKLGNEQCSTCDGYDQHKADEVCGGRQFLISYYLIDKHFGLN